MASFADALARPEPSVIGEFKRQSPSRGVINSDAGIEQVAIEYQEAGISAMSILTDKNFFGGDCSDIQNVAEFIKLPLLRKDFIIDEYQIVESKSIGASAILLIGSVLSKEEVERFSGLAVSLGMDILFEIHDTSDLDKLSDNINIIGINNRNLKTFSIDMKNSQDLLESLPVNCLKVAESGFENFKDVIQMFEKGFDAFLIGEAFMRSERPGRAASDFIKNLKSGLV
jgi:indole-3-glycerol phosphate synthase